MNSVLILCLCLRIVNVRRTFLILNPGFNLITRDSYFRILVKVLKNHILTENTYFMNHIE